VPSFELFREQDQAYKDSLFLANLPKLAVEAGRSIGWTELVGTEVETIGIETFGKSAPAGEAYKALGLTAETIAAKAKKMVK
jgi:transketolase